MEGNSGAVTCYLPRTHLTAERETLAEKEWQQNSRGGQLREEGGGGEFVPFCEVGAASEERGPVSSVCTRTA